MLCAPQNETAKSREQRSHLKITIPSRLSSYGEWATHPRNRKCTLMQCFGLAAITACASSCWGFYTWSARGVDFHSRGSAGHSRIDNVWGKHSTGKKEGPGCWIHSQRFARSLFLILSEQCGARNAYNIPSRTLRSTINLCNGSVSN